MSLWSLGGKISEDYWSASLKMLSDLKFLENLKTFDKDNIPVATMKRIREKYSFLFFSHLFFYILKLFNYFLTFLFIGTFLIVILIQIK